MLLFGVGSLGAGAARSAFQALVAHIGRLAAGHWPFTRVAVTVTACKT